MKGNLNLLDISNENHMLQLLIHHLLNIRVAHMLYYLSSRVTALNDV